MVSTNRRRAQRPSILADFRWAGLHGIGRFATQVLARMPDAVPIPGSLSLLHPIEPIWLSWVVFRMRPRVYFSPGFNPPAWSTAPFVFCIYDLIHLHFPEETGRLKRAYYTAVVRPAVRRAYRVLTDSDFCRQEIVEWAKVDEERVVRVGLGVADEFCPQGRVHSPGYPYLLYVGNRRPHKNVPRLLNAFARAQLPKEVRLLLSGVPDIPTMNSVISARLQNRVVFAGEVPDDELPAHYRGALALIMPSLYEGFGLPALEALACGTPVVAASVTAIPEVVGEAALMVDPLDIDELAGALSAIAADDQLRARLRHAGLERAKRFRWDSVATATRRIVEKAAQGDGGV